MTEYFWKHEIEKATDYDVNAYCRVVRDLTGAAKGYYGEKMLLENYERLSEAHDQMTAMMIKLRAKTERLEAAE